MPSKLRRQIAFQAALLMYYREVPEFHHARFKAARRTVKGWVKPRDLPSDAEIHDQILSLARSFEGRQPDENLKSMRLAAYQVMTHLEVFHPKLVGSVLSGQIRHGSDINLHVFTNYLESITSCLDQLGLRWTSLRKRETQPGFPSPFPSLQVEGDYPIDLSLFLLSDRTRVPKNRVSGKPLARLTLPQFRNFLNDTYPGIDLEQIQLEAVHKFDRFLAYRTLLLPLEQVQQNPYAHPEGDALYHSLQVFDLALNRVPYDEELLLAALLHDVGKAIDPADHVAAGLEALAGQITPRTQWLIEHHMLAHQLSDRSLGARARRRLETSEFYEDLLLLNDCNRQGRRSGASVTDLDAALRHLQELDAW